MENKIPPWEMKELDEVFPYLKNKANEQDKVESGISRKPGSLKKEGLKMILMLIEKRLGGEYLDLSWIDSYMMMSSVQ